MEKTLLEMVEELNRRPVSDRPSIPLAKDKHAAEDDREQANTAGEKPVRAYEKLLSAAGKPQTRN